MEEKTIKLFRDAPVPKAVITNAIPSIVSMVMVMIYNLADTFFIGRTNNALMVAGVSLGTPVFFLFLAVGMLFGIGGTSLISRLLGMGQKEKTKNVSSFCFWSGLAIGIIAMIIILIFREPVARLVGASDDTLYYTSQYLSIVAIGIPFLIISNTFSNIIRAEGKPNVAMIGMVIGNLLNIVLDPIFILVLGWNVAGAATATVCGNLFAATFYIIHLTSKRSILSINPRFYQVRDKIASGVLIIGIPASINSVLMSVSNILINNLVSQYGDMAVAGLGVALKINSIAVMLVIGLGAGVQPLLGYCFGAKMRKRYMSVLRFSLIFGLCLSLVMTVICFAGAVPLVKLFLGSASQEASSFAVSFARIYIYSGPIYGFLFIFTNAIQATGAGVPAMILSISRQGLIYIPVVFIFNYLFTTPQRLVMAQPIADYLTVVLCVILFLFTYRKYIKKFDG